MPGRPIRAPSGYWVSGFSLIWTRTGPARSSGGCSRPTAGSRCPGCPTAPGCWRDGCPRPVRRVRLAILTPLAARRPDDALGEDTRSPAQRLHDAFEEAGRRLLAGWRPARPRRPTRPADHHHHSLTDLERRAGRATTHHGGTLTVPRTHCGWRPTARSCPPCSTNTRGGVLAYGRGRRLASPGQRKALFARDRGCTFPGCDRSAAQSEIHHTTDWALGGHTNLDTMAIACGYHNTEAPKNGWRTVMINGTPHWQPPPWHPEQQPQRNHLHHPELLTNQAQRPTIQ